MSAQHHMQPHDVDSLFPAGPSRFVRFAIACLVCALASLIIGYVSWILFGNRFVEAPQRPATVIKSEPSNTPAPAPTSTPTVLLAPAGELPVPGGEIALGGKDTGQPLRRVIVEPFRVAETEVTNAQYAEFIKATGHQAPEGWVEGEYTPGTALEPVTGVSWQDAADYCSWLSQKIGAPVRIPTEAEWEFAAAGQEQHQYPWGDSWNDRAAASKEKGGQVRAVKSYPEGRSPFGAYDMAGNVWEWTSDDALDADGKSLTKDGSPLKIAKGGAADEPASLLVVSARKAFPSNMAHKSLGFRYVTQRQ
jgi:formylglycine-generating enzyme required for sulfatase activity